MLEVFKNTLSTELYWVLFLIVDLGQVVETAQRILKKEKIDRQLAGQSSLTLYTQNSLEEKTGRLTSMMDKLTTQDDNQTKHFKPKYIKAKGEDRSEISTIEIMVKEIIKIDIDQIVEIGEYRSVVEYNMNRIIVTDQGIIIIMEVI